MTSALAWCQSWSDGRHREAVIARHWQVTPCIAKRGRLAVLFAVCWPVPSLTSRIQVGIIRAGEYRHVGTLTSQSSRTNHRPHSQRSQYAVRRESERF
jgi:hypothetical protein